MSIHDETWNKCPKCKQTIKTWHGNYHDSNGCLEYGSYHDWVDKEVEVDNALIQTMQSELWTIDKEIFIALKAAADAGLEYAQECLLQHDTNLGRTTRKNREWAKVIEGDIAKIKNTLKILEKYESTGNQV